MHLVFLGTGSQYPSKTRGVSCLALRFDNGDIWLFDCGEGSQIQLQKSTLRPGRIRKIFITHMHGDHVFGLPGLLCSIGSWNPDMTDTIEIYGPTGLKEFVQTSLFVSYSLLEYKFVIHELEVLHDVREATLLSHQILMASQLPGRKVQANHSMVWELYEDEQVTVSASMIQHRVPCFGYVIAEKPLPGKLDVAKLASLKIPPGPLYGKLKNGEEIIHDGKLIRPEDVVGPPRPGRKITILGDTSDPSNMEDIARDSHVLVHEATVENSMLQKALENGHSTPEMAAKFATRIGAKQLILTHYSQRYGTVAKPDETHNQQAEAEKSINVLLEEAKMAISDCSVHAAEDLSEFTIPL